MAQKDIYSVIEDLLEADMTKKDEIDNPQDKMAEEDELEEVNQNAANKKNATSDGEKADTATTEPKSDNDGDDSSKVLGSETGAAIDAGGDKDVGDMNKGKIASGASADTQGVEGKETGAALDAGGDKDVGSIDGKTGKPSDASAEVEADEKPHNQASDKGLGEAEEKEEEDPIEEADQDKSVEKNANDEQLPQQDKETLGAEQTTSSEVEADEKDHDQASDPHDTATKANPKTTVSEKDDMEEMDDKEEMSEGEMPDALKKNAEKMKKGELPGQKNEEVKGLDRDGDGDHDKDDHAMEEEYSENVMKAAEMYNENDDCTYEMAAEKYGCSAEEVKACCENMMKESDDDMEEELVGGQKKLDKDKDGDIDAADLAKVRKDGVDEAEEMEEEDEEDMMNEEFKQRASVIFETAVNEKVNTIREEMENEYALKLDEVKQEMNEKVSEYVDYAVQEWMQENALEIRYSLRTEIAENFIRGLKGLFEESYIEIPEEEVSVVDELTEAVEGYKEQIAEQSDELSELRREILTIQKQEIVDEVAEDLTETQKIRLEKLSESVEADDIDEFRYKMEELKEGYFDPTSEQPLLGDLSEEVYGGVVLDENDTTVSQYAKFLSKTVLK